MKAKVDSVGRVVVPKPLREELGLVPGSAVDVARYGAGLQLVPSGRTARPVDEAGALVATADTPIDDDLVFELIDAGRRWARRSRSTPVSRYRCWYRRTAPTRRWSSGGLSVGSRSAATSWRRPTPF